VSSSSNNELSRKGNLVNGNILIGKPDIPVAKITAVEKLYLAFVSSIASKYCTTHTMQEFCHSNVTIRL